MMWYGGYGSYAGFGFFGMIFNLLLLVAIIWAISSLIGKNDDGSDARMQHIEKELEYNRQTMERILRKLE